jgi:DNA polymerase III subunit beta
MTATDLEVGIRCQVPAEVIRPGRITLPARKLFELVRESEETHIHIEEKENFWVRICAAGQ